MYGGTHVNVIREPSLTLATLPATVIGFSSSATLNLAGLDNIVHRCDQPNEGLAQKTEQHCATIGVNP
jgi:hypothetical protein